jgi:Superinfection immunity protein/zinc-ribbon domain
MLLTFLAQTDQPDATNWIAFILIAAVGLFLYFVPTFVGKDKHNAGAIFALNLFLGWTLVGWVVALVWAISKDSPPAPVIVNQPQLPAILCSSCGKYSQAGSKFCANCGAAL